MDTRDDSRYRALLNAIPLMVFVVDDHLRVRDLNDAALAVFGPDAGAVLNRRGGEVLRCLHSYETPEGCGGAAACADCVIRNSVGSSVRGQSVTRKRTKVTLVRGETRKDLELLITASPMPREDDERLSLLILEDISELSQLRDIIPICMHCKRIRDDQQYWRTVEAYFTDFIGVSFSHGLCPSCRHSLYPEYVPRSW